MGIIRIALKCSLLIFFAGSAFADDREQPESDLPDSVVLRAFAHAGSGCPAGTSRGEFPVSGSEFLILWDGFVAQAGAGIPLRDARKNCQINLDLDYTNGWQYTVESIDYNGRVNVADGTQALAGSAYYFQGDANTIRFDTLFDGPVSRTFQIRNTTAPEDQVWSTCDATRSLNVNFQVRLNNASSSDATGSISFGVGATAGTFLKLKWRRCAPQGEI
jgi:hypothetical protein